MPSVLTLGGPSVLLVAMLIGSTLTAAVPIVAPSGDTFDLDTVGLGVWGAQPFPWYNAVCPNTGEAMVEHGNLTLSFPEAGCASLMLYRDVLAATGSLTLRATVTRVVGTPGSYSINFRAPDWVGVGLEGTPSAFCLCGPDDYQWFGPGLKVGQTTVMELVFGADDTVGARVESPDGSWTAEARMLPITHGEIGRISVDAWVPESSAAAVYHVDCVWLLTGALGETSLPC